MPRGPTAYLQLRQDQKGCFERFRCSLSAAALWHCGQREDAFRPGIEQTFAQETLSDHAPPLEESASPVTAFQLGLAVLLFLGFRGSRNLNSIGTRALRSRDSIPAAAAAPRFLLRSK